MPNPDPYTLTLLSPLNARPLRATASFPPAFPGFDGHFPNNPLLPGFFHIQLALDLLARCNLPHTLLEVSTAKFTHPIPPNTEIQITLTELAPHTYEATLTMEDHTCSTFTLKTHPHTTAPWRGRPPRT